MLTTDYFKKTSPLLIAILFCLHANAGIYVITDTNDTTSITSLRGAVIAANRHGGRNTIILGEALNFRDHSRQWVYPLTLSLTVPNIGENGSSVGELAITNGDLTIVGMSESVTIDASNLDNAICVNAPNLLDEVSGSFINNSRIPDFRQKSSIFHNRKQRDKMSRTG